MRGQADGKTARRNGVIVRAISRLYLRAPRRSGIMLGFSGYPRQMIIPAVARLAEALQPMQGRRTLSS
jgi:GntR family transcriptional regulator/MocR family aminotransferase